MNVRELRWGDYEGWVALYYSRYDELAANPGLGVFTMEQRPTLGEESAHFGNVWKRILAGDMLASVAEDDRSLVGLCTVVRAGHLEDHHVGSLGIAILPSHRNRGIGTQLMQHVLSECEGKFSVLTLNVIAGNEPALRLYRRFGFTQRGRVPGTFRRAGVVFDEIIMSREIGPPNPP
ncbi:MAG TPA: GNAT family N-acetyltransferase [Thermoplasmata archaeon]|nr:GNAT family N-acetyltransferase [Thermoplasmata archaeon]